MKKEEYIKRYREIKLFKVVYKFTKRWEEMPIIPETRYFLAFDMTGAMKECINNYCLGDRKYVEILDIEELGYPNGIHHFV
jgi:hypothetical protein